eukprot:jgi/Ulvmu1/5035/UM021_0052.1
MPVQDAVYFGYGGELRSGFGRQVLGPQPTAPNVGFGSSARAASQHIYASAEHDRAKVKSAGGNQSQGAIYQVPDSLGKQVLSSKSTAPSCGVGTEQRKSLATNNGFPGPGLYKVKAGLGAQVESYKETSANAVFGSGTREQREKVYQDAESEKTYFGRLSPGPCTYDAKSGVGQQVLSSMRSNPATTLGFGKRFNYDFVKRAKEQPGAGEYKGEQPACGRQALSKKKSLPLYSFGTSDRDQARKVYMSREHEKGQKGDFSPGPTTAQQWSGSGRQILSKKKTQPRCAFGTATRFGKYYYSSAVSPGPAAYAA